MVYELHVEAGDEVKVLGYSDDKEWANVDAGHGKIGWIRAQHLSPIPLSKESSTWRHTPSAVVGPRPCAPAGSWVKLEKHEEEGAAPKGIGWRGAGGGPRPGRRAAGPGPGPRAVGHPWARAPGLGPGLGGWCVCVCARCVFVRRACVQRVWVCVRACVSGIKPLPFRPRPREKEYPAAGVKEEKTEEVPTVKEEEEMHDEDWFTPWGRAVAAARAQPSPTEATNAAMEVAAAEFDEADAGVLPTHPLSSCLLIPCLGRRPRGPGPGLGARRVRGPGYPGPGCGLGASLAILCRYLIRRPAGRAPGAGGGWPGGGNVGDVVMAAPNLTMVPSDLTQPPPKVVPDRRRIHVKSRGELTIYTIGQHCMNMNHVDHVAIQLWFRNEGYRRPDMVENCKHLGEAPESGHLLIRHPGLHCDNIMQLSQHSSFLALIAKLAPSICNHLAMCRKLTIALVCRHGRHRSVAAAAVLEALVKHTFGIEPEVVHLGRHFGTWDRLQCDGRCDSCAWQALAPLGCVRPRALGPVPWAWAPGPPGRARAPGPFPGPRPRPRPPASRPGAPGPGPGPWGPGQGIDVGPKLLDWDLSIHPLKQGGVAEITMAAALNLCLEAWTAGLD